MKIKHYDLFAGIGGFSYALDTIFNEQENEHIFCEWERFPTAVLKKHWPDATYYGDIADLVTDTERERLERSEQDKATGHTGQRRGERSDEAQDLTILTGGFPCQPFSHAGRRKGTSDDRYKWPDMFAVIRNIQPDWVIAENVRGLASWNDGMVLETVCADLESEGYEVRPYIIPACSKGAPHRRERVWIVAHANRIKSVGEKSGGTSKESKQEVCDRQSDSTTRESYGTNRQLPEDRKSDRHDRTTTNCKQPCHQDRLSDFQWENSWQEVALATCHDGVDDGLPRKLDGATYRGKPTNCISAAQHRKDRLKACGNAIVPQVAMELFTAIKRTLY